MKVILHASILLCLSATIAGSSSAQTGTPDLTFGTNGKVVSDLGTNESTKKVALQSDGKIVVCGTSVNGSSTDFFVARYNTDGSLDASFGTGGKTFIDFSGNSDEANAMVIQTNDKIVVAGTTSFENNGNRAASFALVRLKKSGVIDSTFGSAGTGEVVTTFEGTAAYATAISQNGTNKFLVSGTGIVDENHSGVEIAEYTFDGMLNPTFNSTGKKFIDFGLTDTKATSLLVLPNGRIVIGGYYSASATNTDIMLASVNPLGAIDTTFGTGGLVTFDISGKNDVLHSLAFQTGLKIVAAGASFNDNANTDGDFSMARFTNDGVLDATFGTNGKVITDYNATNNVANTVFANSGRIYLSGYSSNGSASSFLTASYYSDGLQDAAFGTNGFAETMFDNAAAIGTGMVLQTANKKIVVAGKVTANGTTNGNVALARYDNEQALPVTFVAFNAVKQQHYVLLTWQTANEVNNKYFSVERSAALNRDFSEISKVNSKGQSSQLQTYQSTDLQPQQGWNYYRLKQVDVDGKFTYSATASVLFDGNIVVAVYPNPAHQNLFVEGLKDGSATTIKIINANGKVVSTVNTTSSLQKINISNLASGVYYITISQNGSVTKTSFVKN